MAAQSNDVWRRRWKHWLDAGVRVSHGHREEYAVGAEIEHSIGFGSDRLGIDYRILERVMHCSIILSSYLWRRSAP